MADGRRWARRLRALLAGALTVGGLSGLPADAADGPFCEVMDVSPAFAVDHTAFCGSLGASSLVVYRTVSAGRSWQRVASTAVRLPDGSRATQLIVSADYAHDRTVYLATDTVLYVSRDAGDSFLPVDWLAGDNSGRRVFTPYLDTTAGAEIPYLAFGAYQNPARLSPPSHEAVSAALPSYTERFLIPRRVTASVEPLLIAFTSDGAGHISRTVHACTSLLACPSRRAALASTTEITGSWLSPSYATDRTVYLATNANGFSFLRSTDSGRSFAPWTPLNAALAPITKEFVRRGLYSRYPPTLTFGPGRQMFLRLIPGFVDDGRLPPAQVLLRSDDAGAHWRQVGAFYDGEHRRGNMPFGPVANMSAEAAAQILATPDGRLFALGTEGSELGGRIYCSVDGGVRWSHLCPR